MYLTTLTLLALTASSLAAPEAIERPAHLEKRQNDNIPQLLSLASQAGITLPTNDPALLFRLAPLANQLASALPTSPVLSALQTAAPSDFVSNIVNNPSYASSFESAFAAGSSRLGSATFLPL
ncbi:60S ribosomal protein L35 [Physcia stellaris]|nr:60S ribosomal protein L35 [Physcia stellaris]